MICTICQKLIIGQYLVDTWGNNYHKACYSNATFCGSCLCPVVFNSKPKPIQLSHSDFVCGCCVNDGIIVDNSKLEKCVIANYLFFSFGGINLPKSRISIEFAKPLSLKNNMYGIVTTANHFATGLKSYTIEMRLGLSKSLFCAGLAHELMHVWLYENNLGSLSLVESEGLCELARYFAFKMMGTPFALQSINNMHHNPDPIYGEGFRISFQLLKKYGSLQRVVDTFITKHSVKTA